MSVGKENPGKQKEGVKLNCPLPMNNFSMSRVMTHCN